MKLQAYGFSDIGKKRQQNQDSVLVSSDLPLFAIADGMGGHQGGELASQTALACMEKYFDAHRNEPLRDRLKNAIKSANQNIFDLAQNDIQLRGMGTTTIAASLDTSGGRPELYVAHVGDSRCYLLTTQGGFQLTSDHSFVQEKLNAGLITREQAKIDQTKNVITRSVGFENTIEVDVTCITPSANQVYLLCSDGLTSMLEDDEIFKIVSKELFSGLNGSLENAVHGLINAANARGGEDNVTVVLIYFNSDQLNI